MAKKYDPTSTLSTIDAVKLLSEENEAFRKANRSMAANLGHYRMWWEVKVKPLLAAAKRARKLLPYPGGGTASTIEMEIEAAGYLDQAIDAMEPPPQ